MSQRRHQDHFARRAKREGYSARSIYKLEEIDKRWQLLRQGSRVFDLGSAPGSWVQYAAERVGSTGYVLGIDLKPISLSLPGHVEVQQGDAFDLTTEKFEPASFDVVLSDMAPATMGDHKIDATRSAALAEKALSLAEFCLRPKGKFVVKLLEGKDIEALVRQMRHTFDKVERLRPDATRKNSTEIFLIGLGKK